MRGHQDISQFFRDHIAGMLIFAVGTGLLVNYLYDKIKFQQTSPQKHDVASSVPTSTRYSSQRSSDSGTAPSPVAPAPSQPKTRPTPTDIYTSPAQQNHVSTRSDGSTSPTETDSTRLPVSKGSAVPALTQDIQPQQGQVPRRPYADPPNGSNTEPGEAFWGFALSRNKTVVKVSLRATSDVDEAVAKLVLRDELETREYSADDQVRPRYLLAVAVATRSIATEGCSSAVEATATYRVRDLILSKEISSGETQASACVVEDLQKATHEAIRAAVSKISVIELANQIRANSP